MVKKIKLLYANKLYKKLWLIDCETFLKIIPCSHGPHLTREKTATALKASALCQILLMGHFRRRPVLAPGAAFFQLPFPFDAIGSGR